MQGKKAHRKRWRCPHCGGRVVPIRKVKSEDIIWDEKRKCWTLDPKAAKKYGIKINPHH